VAVEALLQRHLRQQVVDRDGHRLLDHALDGDAPRPHLQLFGLADDVLAGPELVEVVVSGRQPLVADRPVELVLVVAGERIEPRGGIRRGRRIVRHGEQRTGTGQDRS
jgi:hypothetical protein